MVNTVKKNLSKRNIKPNSKNLNPQGNPNKFNKYISKDKIKSKSKGKFETNEINEMDLEEEKILKDFQLMENRLKGLKNINKAKEIKNAGPNGVIEKTLIKSNPEKKLRRDFKGCAVKSTITVYENIDENSKHNEYLEVKKIYRKCPK